VADFRKTAQTRARDDQHALSGAQRKTRLTCVNEAWSASEKILARFAGGGWSSSSWSWRGRSSGEVWAVDAPLDEAGGTPPGVVAGE
jgi:hypothetical protein